MATHALLLPEKRARELQISADTAVEDEYNGPPPDSLFQYGPQDRGDNRLTLSPRVYNPGDFVEVTVGPGENADGAGQLSVGCSLADPNEIYVDGVRVNPTDPFPGGVYAGAWVTQSTVGNVVVRGESTFPSYYTYLRYKAFDPPKTVRFRIDPKFAREEPTLGGRNFTYTALGYSVDGLPAYAWRGPCVTLSGEFRHFEVEGFVVRGGGPRVEGLQAQPSTVELGSTVNISANITAAGLNSPQGTFEMTIMPVDGTSTAVKNFAGNLQFADTTAHLTQTWNGRTDAGVDFPRGDCRIELSVTVTEAGRGEPRTASANSTVRVGGGPTFEVVQGSKVLGRAVASIIDITTGQQVVFPTPSSEDELRVWARELGTVFPYGLGGTDNTWTLKARNLEFTGNQPPPLTITAHFKSLVSGVEKSVELEQTEPGRPNYEGQFELGDDFILKDDRLTRNGTTVRTRFTSADDVTGLGTTEPIPGGAGSLAFTQFMQGLEDQRPPIHADSLGSERKPSVLRLRGRDRHTPVYAGNPTPVTSHDAYYESSDQSSTPGQRRDAQRSRHSS